MAKLTDKDLYEFVYRADTPHKIYIAERWLNEHKHLTSRATPHHTKGKIMTTNELHDILDDENKKLSLKEMREVIHQLENDVIQKAYEYCNRTNEQENYKYGFYMGEINAFILVLDLLEHLEQKNRGD